MEDFRRIFRCGFDPPGSFVFRVGVVAVPLFAEIKNTAFFTEFKGFLEVDFADRRFEGVTVVIHLGGERFGFFAGVEDFGTAVVGGDVERVHFFGGDVT